MMIQSNPLLSLKSIALFLIISTASYFVGTAILGGDKQQSTTDETSTDQTGILTMEQLVELVGPIALYPDELLAIVIPASTYPLEIVQGSRFLVQYNNQPDLKPEETWDPSILGLLNYPEVVELMNNDLNWTWKLGRAVVNQQDDLMEAIQQFRNKVQVAGNLESNDNQFIIVENEVIKIESASPEVIYVPSYRPSTVIVQQMAPYPYYYSAPYPYYYRPDATFWTGVFVGAAITYGIRWGRHGRWYGRGRTDINVYHDGNNKSGSNIWESGGGNRPGNRLGLWNRPGTGARPGTGKKPSAGSFGGYKSGHTTSRNSQRGQKSRTSQSNYKTSRHLSDHLDRDGGSER